MRLNTEIELGGSPGLMVKGGDSKSEGCEFESWLRILDEHFLTLIYCKICVVCLEINEKEAKESPLKKH